jgi:hypothetical protein
MGKAKYYINEEGTYDANFIENALENLKVFKPNPMEVHTNLNNKLISKANVSEKYEAFDFSNFVLDYIDVIEKQFNPTSFQLRIHKGYQEIRLFSEIQQINLEEYKPMFVIMNSSNCSFPLSVNFGMLRLVCSNGMVIGKEGEHFGFKVKHYKNAISNRIEDINSILLNFQDIFQRNRELLEVFSDATISYSQFLKMLILNDENVPLISQVKNARLLGKKLLTSTSDAIEKAQFDAKQLLAIEKPELLLLKDNSTKNLFLSKYKVFQCYTEIFRNYNSAIQTKETNKIFNILNSLN